MIFLKGNFPSFKNSRQRTKTGFLVMSKTVQRYLKVHEEQWETIPEEFKDIKEEDYPLEIGIFFVRGTRHRFDLHNMIQGVADLMVKHGWIPDDNSNYFIPIPLNINGKYYDYDKENPGVFLKILDKDNPKDRYLFVE